MRTAFYFVYKMQLENVFFKWNQKCIFMLFSWSNLVEVLYKWKIGFWMSQIQQRVTSLVSLVINFEEWTKKNKISKLGLFKNVVIQFISSFFTFDINIDDVLHHLLLFQICTFLYLTTIIIKYILWWHQFFKQFFCSGFYFIPFIWPINLCCNLFVKQSFVFNICCILWLFRFFRFDMLDTEF